MSEFDKMVYCSLDIAGFLYAGASIFGVPYLATPVVGLLLACVNYPVRKALKKQYGITSDPGCCPDCGLVTMCELCVLCQQARDDAIDRPRPSGGFVWVVNTLHRRTDRDRRRFLPAGC